MKRMRRAGHRSWIKRCAAKLAAHCMNLKYRYGYFLMVSRHRARMRAAG